MLINKLIRQNAWTIAAILFLFALLFALGQIVPEETIRMFLIKAGIWAPIIYILLMLTTYVVAPLNATPLIFAGFYAFGQNVVIYSSIAAFISSITNFLIARKWGRSIVEKFVGNENMEKIDKLTKEYGLFTIFVLRVFHGGSHDFLSYAAGLSSLKFKSYLTFSTLGMIPGTMLWYYLSQKVETPTAFTILTIILTIILTFLFIIGAIAFKKIKNKQVKV
ncbi:MAG: VTT domain-containing protein [bacterium]|nr:VTT domain-containing protein [bacterium]